MPDDQQEDYVNSILNSVKKTLGMVEYDFFDPDLIVHINSVFADLNQIGVGPESGFSISDKTQTWSDFLESNSVLLQNVKSYMFLRVKMLFDPPNNSVIQSSMERQANEFVYRMYVLTDNQKHPIEDKKGGIKHE